MKGQQITWDIYGEDLNGFKESGGWLSRFLRRKQLVCRRVTTVDQKIPANSKTVANSFVAKIKDGNGMLTQLHTFTSRHPDSVEVREFDWE